jgi:hypothetical protein
MMGESVLPCLADKDGWQLIQFATCVSTPIYYLHVITLLTTVVSWAAEQPATTADNS